MSRLALTVALEALEAGDSRHAVDTLLGALEELDPTSAREGGRPRCPHCRLEFDWPGLLDRHLATVHSERAAA